MKSKMENAKVKAKAYDLAKEKAIQAAIALGMFTAGVMAFLN